MTIKNSMVTGRRPPQLRPVDMQIRALESELWQARSTVMDLLPNPIANILHSYHLCASIDDTYAWSHVVVQRLIDITEPLTDLHSLSGLRAPCPLCKGEAQSAYERGFSLPSGLKRHLEGSAGSPICAVFAAAKGLALSSWERKFKSRGSNEHFAEHAKEQARRVKETLYCVGPHLNPKLLDELPFVSNARSPDKLKWAEGRLSDLGFILHTEAKVKTWTREDGIGVTFADHRVDGTISFLVTLKPFPPSRQFVLDIPMPHRNFSLSDKRTKDLRKFVDETIRTSIDQLKPPLRRVV